LPYTIAELAERLQVSQNHAMKIVHFIAKQDWLITTRGKGGGIRLNPLSLNLQLGQIVRILQRDSNVVECNNPTCVLRPTCGLIGILDDSVEQLYSTLDQYLLQDVITLQNARFSRNSPISLINL